MSEYAQLIRLGGAYERADQARDYARKVLLEAQINELAEQINGVPQMLVLRGRNIIRKARSMELLHV